MLNEYAQIAHQKFLAREREKLRADKCLRDAAPDLLAALRAAITVLAADRSRQGVYAYQQASAAIAKAEGR